VCLNLPRRDMEPPDSIHGLFAQAEDRIDELERENANLREEIERLEVFITELEDTDHSEKESHMIQPDFKNVLLVSGNSIIVHSAEQDDFRRLEDLLEEVGYLRHNMTGSWGFTVNLYPIYRMETVLNAVYEAFDNICIMNDDRTLNPMYPPKG
jgi:hypothetical protein